MAVHPVGRWNDIDYRAALDVKAPLPGFILRRVTDGLVAASLPNMFASIEREVRKRQARPADVRTSGVEEAQLARRPGAGVVDADARRARAAWGRGAVVGDVELARAACRSWPLSARVIASVAHSLPGPVSGWRRRAWPLPSLAVAAVETDDGRGGPDQTAPATPSLSVTTFMQWCMP